MSLDEYIQHLKNNVKTAEDLGYAVERIVYDSLDLIESVGEGNKLIWGNGHHIRQHLAREAKEYVMKRARVTSTGEG